MHITYWLIDSIAIARPKHSHLEPFQRLTGIHHTADLLIFFILFQFLHLGGGGVVSTTGYNGMVSTTECYNYTTVYNVHYLGVGLDCLLYTSDAADE